MGQGTKGRTVKDQETLGQTDGHRKGIHGEMTDTLSENMGGGQLRQHLPTPTLHFRRAPQFQKAVVPLGAWLGSALTTALEQEDRCERGEDWAVTGWLPLCPLPPTGRRLATGAFQAQHLRVLFPPLAAQAPQRRQEAAQAVAATARGQPWGQGGRTRHMMAQRLRRSAPWKRRAACTCLQRAQPTLLSSSLNSSRMCQLYLAEHST